ncbi:MAG TPA: hypothetical protein DCY13_00290 [Verrucomicrobiales bacterium]|nr:hypothetical protein [Verrucomicrobiales bacterium]
MSVSYLTFRRRYQTICTLTAFVLAFAAFIIVASFPDWVGLIDRSNPSDDVRIGGPATFIAVAALAVAILVARWVFRKGRPLLARIFLDGWR